MDLVAGVRKEGSRGGRAEFKWSDVTTSTHRENYLGHSLMAPVGRWQKNKDLSWYARGNGGDDEEAKKAAEEARREEIRRVKEAEQDALGEALGFGPAPKRVAGGNANEVPLGEREVRRIVGEREGEREVGGGKGVGFGAFAGGGDEVGVEGREVLGGEGDAAAAVGGTPEERALKRIIEEERARKRKRSRSRSRGPRRSRAGEGDRERRHGRDGEEDGRARRRHHHRHYHHHHREKDQSRERERRPSRDREDHRHTHRSEKYRARSYDRRRSHSRTRRRYSAERDRGYERQR